MKIFLNIHGNAAKFFLKGTSVPFNQGALCELAEVWKLDDEDFSF